MKKLNKKNLKKASPTLLSCFGAVGVIGTSALAVKATPKALRKIRADSRENHNDPNAYTKLEAIQSAWIYYVPSVVMGAATIICIFGANILNKRQQAALTSAYALLNDAYQDYRDKLKELYGDDAHRKIMEAIAVEKADDVYIASDGFIGGGSLDIEEHNPDDNILFYDSYSKRYFESSLNRVIQAEYYSNRDFAIGTQLSVNDFYGFLGLDPIDDGDEIGWTMSSGYSWIDFRHYKTTMEDGLEVCIIDMDYVPELDFEQC